MADGSLPDIRARHASNVLALIKIQEASHTRCKRYMPMHHGGRLSNGISRLCDSEASVGVHAAACLIAFAAHVGVHPRLSGLYPSKAR